MLEQKTLQEFKEELSKEKKHLEQELGKIAKKENGEYEAKFEDFGRDEEDNAEEVENYANKVGITETLEKELHNVEKALIRIEKGTYGICENCNQEIPLERLKANPSASICLQCAKK
jgi:RNA polymerase-binding transcription factor